MNSSRYWSGIESLSRNIPLEPALTKSESLCYASTFSFNSLISVLHFFLVDYCFAVNNLGGIVLPTVLETACQILNLQVRNHIHFSSMIG